MKEIIITKDHSLKEVVGKLVITEEYYNILLTYFENNLTPCIGGGYIKGDRIITHLTIKSFGVKK